MSSLRWNECPVCRGISVQFAVEWVSSLARKTQNEVDNKIKHEGAVDEVILISALAVRGQLTSWPAIEAGSYKENDQQCDPCRPQRVGKEMRSAQLLHPPDTDSQR